MFWVEKRGGFQWGKGEGSVRGEERKCSGDCE